MEKTATIHSITVDKPTMSVLTNLAAILGVPQVFISLPMTTTLTNIVPLRILAIMNQMEMVRLTMEKIQQSQGSHVFP